MIVKDLMSPLSHQASPTDSLERVIEIMHEHTLSCVLVGKNDCPIGIITERDLVRAMYKKHKHGHSYTLAEMMTENPICVHETTKLQDALTLARSHNIRHLPVVNHEDKLTGVVTQIEMINAFLTSLEHNSKLEAANKELELLSFVDPLLGIGNRRSMEVELNFTESSAKRYRKAFSVALIDVDYFKCFNDHYGHVAGDNALIQITDSIKAGIRHADRLYRYGGEEFLLLMPNTAEDGALNTAERIRQHLCEKKVEHIASPLGRLTISIGIATSSLLSWQELVDISDNALYQAKRTGRNRVRAADLHEQKLKSVKKPIITHKK